MIDKALALCDTLIDALHVERDARGKRWREVLAAQALARTDDEINALLLLDPN